jgi:hypothetical protein
MAARKPKKTLTSKPNVIKKNTGTKKVPPKNPTINKPLVNSLSVSTPLRKKTEVINKNEYEYVKVPGNTKENRFNEIGQKVQSGELQWAYYAVENDIGYHFYRKLK